MTPLQKIIEKQNEIFDERFPNYGEEILKRAKTATEIMMAENEIIRRNKIKFYIFSRDKAIADGILEMIENLKRKYDNANSGTFKVAEIGTFIPIETGDEYYNQALSNLSEAIKNSLNK